MTSRQALIAFLATLGAIVAIVGLSLVAVALGVKNREAFVVLASAVTGLVAVIGRFALGKGGGDEG